MGNQNHKIVFIGSGNVATRLALVLKEAGNLILQVYSRNENHAKSLAHQLDCRFTADLSDLNTGADLYILSLSDEAMGEVVEHLPLDEQLIAHTSGSVSMDVLHRFKNHGVFYPLQTFSKEKEISFNDIPICLEANTKENLNRLKDFATLISENIHTIDSEKRRVLHTAAVFASNFTNYLYSAAEEILIEQDLSLDLLKPLILETASKIKHQKPHEAQTGPARRNDQQTITKHLESLQNNPEYQHLYKLISEHIKRKHHSND